MGMSMPSGMPMGQPSCMPMGQTMGQPMGQPMEQPMGMMGMQLACSILAVTFGPFLIGEDVHISEVRLD